MVLNNNHIEIVITRAELEITRGCAPVQIGDRNGWAEGAPANALREDFDKERRDVQRRDARHHAVAVVIKIARRGVGEVLQEGVKTLICTKCNDIDRPVVVLELRSQISLDSLDLRL